MKHVVIACSIAAVFWFLMFSPWTKEHLNFWLTMALAAGTLSGYSYLAERREWPKLYRYQDRYLFIGLIGAAVLYLLFFVGDIVSRALFDFAQHQVAGVYSTKLQASRIMIGTLLLFLIGPSEEIFWRGFVQHRLMQRFGDWKGYFLTTAIYALIHVWAFNFMLFMAALICGLFWGWIFMKYRNVWPGLISHAVWDVTIFILLPIQHM